MNKFEGAAFYAVGDIAPWRDDPVTIFRHVKPVRRRGLLRLLSVRGLYIGQGSENASGNGCNGCNNKPFAHQDVRDGSAIKDAGFHVVSFANLYCLDLGYDASLNTINAVREQGMDMIGVGANLEEARKPAIFWNARTRESLSLPTIQSCPRIIGPFPTDPDALLSGPQQYMSLWSLPSRGRLSRVAHILTVAIFRQWWMISKKQKRKPIWSLCPSTAVFTSSLPCSLTIRKTSPMRPLMQGRTLCCSTTPTSLKGIKINKGKVVFYSLSNFAVEYTALSRTS